MLFTNIHFSFAPRDVLQLFVHRAFSLADFTLFSLLYLCFTSSEVSAENIGSYFDLIEKS